MTSDRLWTDNGRKEEVKRVESETLLRHAHVTGLSPWDVANTSF